MAAASALAAQLAPSLRLLGNTQCPVCLPIGLCMAPWDALMRALMMAPCLALILEPRGR